MPDVLTKLARVLASARAIPLYKDQEEELNKIREALSKRGAAKPAITELVRSCVDLGISIMETELDIKEDLIDETKKKPSKCSK